MTIDPKMQGAPIVRRTACQVGSHSFTWSGSGTKQKEPPDRTVCSCGAYEWHQWEQLQEQATRISGA